MIEITEQNNRESAVCAHDWKDEGRINDSYSRGYGIVSYGYKCKKCGEKMEVEKDIL